MSSRKTPKKLFGDGFGSSASGSNKLITISSDSSQREIAVSNDNGGDFWSRKFEKTKQKYLQSELEKKGEHLQHVLAGLQYHYSRAQDHLQSVGNRIKELEEIVNEVQEIADDLSTN